MPSRATDEDYEYVMSRVFWIFREKVFTRLKSKDYYSSTDGGKLQLDIKVSTRA